MKKGVVVTNRHNAEPTPIIFVGLADPEARVELVDAQHTRTDGFIFDFSKEEITVAWGGRERMTGEEAARFGADFGLWFSS